MAPGRRRWRIVELFERTDQIKENSMGDKSQSSEASASRSLRLVSYLFMFLGIGTFAWMIAAPFMDRSGINLFWIFAPFAAIGLFRGKSGRQWRGYCLVGLVFLLIGCAYGVGNIAYRLITGEPYKSYYLLSSRIGIGIDVLAILGLLLVSGIVIWAWLVLRSKSTDGFFGQSQHAKISRGAGGMLILAGCLSILVVLVSIYINNLENAQDMGSTVSTGGGRLSSTRCGYRYGRLAYVVFEEAEGTLKSKVQESYSRHHRDVKFKKPDGRIVHLPNAIQLYEFIDGQFRQSPVRVTRAEFEAFMDSDPERYCNDSLLAFVQAYSEGT